MTLGSCCVYKTDDVVPASRGCELPRSGLNEASHCDTITLLKMTVDLFADLQ